MARVAHLRVALLAVALTLSLGACGSSSKKTGAGSAITIQGFAFSPNPLSAKAGGTITVTNKDNVSHSFTADAGSFDTGVFASGSKTVKLTKAGTIAYHCNIHSFMHGTLQVR